MFCRKLGASVAAAGIAVLLTTTPAVAKPSVELYGCQTIAKSMESGAVTVEGLDKVSAGVDILEKSRKPAYVVLVAKWHNNDAVLADLVNFCHKKFGSDKKITKAWKIVRSGG